MASELRRLFRKMTPIGFRQFVKARIARTAPAQQRFQGDSDAVLQCRVAYNDYGAFCIPLNSQHRPAAQMVMSGRTWEAETVQFIGQNIGSGDMVHAGTYFGDMLPAVSSFAQGDAKIWAFEPNFENYRCASITVQLNSLQDRVALHHAGLGAEKSQQPLLIEDSKGRKLGGTSKFVATESLNGAKSAMIDIVTIDETVPSDRHVTILHLDVEGFEEPALCGAVETIKRCKPILILETPPHEWLSENVFPLGYQKVTEVDENSIYHVN